MPDLPGKKFIFETTQDHQGRRLDHFLQEALPELSRSRIKQLIQEGGVQLNGKTPKPSNQLKGGEKLQVIIPPAVPLEIQGKDIPIEIIYEDSDILAVNKSPEMVVHPGAGSNETTLVHALLHHCQDLSGIGGKLRPGIVHRLDKGTSGVLLVAKNDLAHQGMSEAFQNREVQKTYFALVWGVPKMLQGKIESAIGRDQRDRKKISSRGNQKREALTRYRTLESLGPIGLLELCPETGRTHQIRVHLSELGHPVVGDPLYGKGKRRMASLPRPIQDYVEALPYQLLHATRLQLKHPISGKLLEIEVEMREEMKVLLELLRKEYLKSDE